MVEPKEVLGEDVAQGQTSRHQDVALVKKRGEAKLFKNDSEVPGPVM